MICHGTAHCNRKLFHSPENIEIWQKIENILVSTCTLSKLSEIYQFIPSNIWLLFTWYHQYDEYVSQIDFSTRSLNSEIIEKTDFLCGGLFFNLTKWITEDLAASFLCRFHNNQIPRFECSVHCTSPPPPPALPSPPPCPGRAGCCRAWAPHWSWGSTSGWSSLHCRRPSALLSEYHYNIKYLSMRGLKTIIQESIF